MPVNARKLMSKRDMEGEKGGGEGWQVKKRENDRKAKERNKRKKETKKGKESLWDERKGERGRKRKQEKQRNQRWRENKTAKKVREGSGESSREEAFGMFSFIQLWAFKACRWRRSLGSLSSPPPPPTACIPLASGATCLFPLACSIIILLLHLLLLPSLCLWDHGVVMEMKSVAPTPWYPLARLCRYSHSTG